LKTIEPDSDGGYTPFNLDGKGKQENIVNPFSKTLNKKLN
jgi:hypothetical protein